MTDRNSMIRKPVPNWVSWLIVGLAVLFAVGSLVINRADVVAFILLGFVGIALVFTQRVRLSFPLRLVAWASAAILFVAVISYRFGIQTDIGVREAGRFLRFLGFGPLVAAFLTLDRKQRRWIWFSIPVGGMLCGFVAGFQVYFSSHLARAFGESFPILFGDLAITTAFFSAFAYLPLRTISPRIALFLATLGFLGGIFASFLSGTRGAWLAILPTSIFLFWAACRRLGAKRAASMATLMVGVLFVGLRLPQDGVQYRLDKTVKVWQSYYYGRHALRELSPSFGCLDNKGFLDNFLRNIRSRKNSKASIKVVPVNADPRDVLGKPCSLNYAIELNNRHGERGAWLAFGRGLPSSNPRSKLALLVRGKGWVRPAHGAKRQSFSHSDFTLFSIQSVPANTSISLSVRKGGRIAFVPVATIKGEYFFNYADSSVGLRFEMWRAAWDLFLSKPILGVGMGGFRARVRSLANEGVVAPAIAQFNHPHNQYLAELSSRGLLGFVSLLILFFLVGTESSRGLGSLEVEVIAASGCGLVLVIGYAIFGLTETVFAHSMAIIYFSIFSAFFLSVVHGPRAVDESDSRSVVS